MTNGEVLRVRAAMKPISTVPRALATIDIATGEPAVAINQRSDVCAVPRGGVVMEAMVALALADAVLEKFGGDSVTETRRNVRPTSTRCRSDERPGRSSSSVRRPREDDGRHRRSPRRSACRSGTPTHDVEARRRPWPTCSSTYGEPRFRELGERAVAAALAEHAGVLALGGGAVHQ